MSVSYQIEQKHSLRQVVAIAYTLEKRLLTTVIFNGFYVVTFKSKKACTYFGLNVSSSYF